jgi:hypothetical protein
MEQLSTITKSPGSRAENPFSETLFAASKKKFTNVAPNLPLSLRFNYVSQMDPSKCKYFDESGFKLTTAHINYGYGLVGEKCVEVRRLVDRLFGVR